MSTSTDLILRYLPEGGTWREMPLPEGELTIGRGDEAQLRLESSAVSRLHARLRRQGSRIWVKDLGSTNGTQVDGSPLTPHVELELRTKQIITIGACSLVVNRPEDTAPLAAPARKRPAGHDFISYSHQDQALAFPLADRLEVDGFKIWIDREAIQPGRPWRGQIVQAIYEADAFVLLLSPASAASENVVKELDLAAEAKTLVLPVFLEQVPIPDSMKYQLIDLQYINLIDDPENGYTQLTSALKKRQEYLAQHPELAAPARRQVELVLPAEKLRAFNQEKKQRLLSFLGRISQAPATAFSIASTTAGSVRVIVDMPASIAYELKAQALNNDPLFAEAGISAMRLVGDRAFIQLGGTPPAGGGQEGQPPGPSGGGPFAGSGIFKLFLWGILAVAVIAGGIALGRRIFHPAGSAAPATAAMRSATPTRRTATLTPTARRELPPPTAPPTPAGFVCRDLLGCIDIARDDPIQLGFLLDLSEEPDLARQDVLAAIQKAIEDHQGILLDHKIDLVGEETQCSPAGGEGTAQKLLKEGNLVGVIGTICSSSALGASPVFSRAGMVMISPANTALSLTDPSRDWRPGYYRTIPNDIEQSYLAADFALHVLGVKTAAILRDRDPNAAPLSAAFRSRFEELGGRVLFEDQIDAAQTDLSGLAARIRKERPQLVYIPVFMEAGRNLLAALYKGDLPSTWRLAPNFLMGQAFIQSLGGSAKDLLITDIHLRGKDYEIFQRYWVERYDRYPSSYAVFAYDAVNLLFNALERSAQGDEAGGLHFGRQVLRDNLTATRDFPGVSGLLSCGPHGDCASMTALGVYTIDPDVIEKFKWPPDLYPTQIP